jgi:hypothetical protein
MKRAASLRLAGLLVLPLLNGCGTEGSSKPTPPPATEAPPVIETKAPDSGTAPNGLKPVAPISPY